MFFPHDVTFRPSVEADLDRVLPLVRSDGVCSLTADGYLAKLEDGQYCHERTWIAVDGGGEFLALAVWWATPGAAKPAALDAVFAHEALDAAEWLSVGSGLLNAAHEAFAERFGLSEPPEYHMFVPGDWRDRPDVVEAWMWRYAVAERSGFETMLERLRFEWTPADGPVEPSGRLEFRPEPDDAVFAELFVGVLNGSLDTTSTRQAAQLGAVKQARQDLAFLRDEMLGERSWWRIAMNRNGQAVGFAIPSRNQESAVVGYLGVLPEHRGHGYACDILAEITRILLDEAGATTIHADTDLVNKPMAEAFLRVGYRIRGRRLVLSANRPTPEPT